MQQSPRTAAHPTPPKHPPPPFSLSPVRAPLTIATSAAALSPPLTSPSPPPKSPTLVRHLRLSRLRARARAQPGSRTCSSSRRARAATSPASRSRSTSTTRSRCCSIFKGGPIIASALTEMLSTAKMLLRRHGQPKLHTKSDRALDSASLHWPWPWWVLLPRSDFFSWFLNENELEIRT